MYANVSLEKLTLYHFIIIHTLVNPMIHQQMTFLFLVLFVSFFFKKLKFHFDKTYYEILDFFF